MITDDVRQWYDFSGQTVVLTGGTGVLGREILCALVEAGATVAVLSRQTELPAGVQARLGKARSRAQLFTADVLDRDTLTAAAETITTRYGAPLLLVNGAGGNRPAATTSPTQRFFDLPEQALRDVLELNLMGTMLPCQVFGRAMATAQRGVILNISSMSAYRPLTRVAAYSAAKAGLVNFTQWLATHMALEYSPHIRVNAIAPGFFLTEQNRFLMLTGHGDELTTRGQAIFNHIPMARFGQPADLVGAALWLLSSASAYVTGIVVPIDGGFSAYNGV